MSASRFIYAGELKQSTAIDVDVFALQDDHLTPATGIATGDWTVKSLKKQGGSHTGVTPTVTESAYGGYVVSLTGSHTDTLGYLVLHLEMTNVDDVNFIWRVVSFDPTNPGWATASALATVQSDTDDIQSRLPAALVSGRMDSSVGAMAANVMTAAAAAADLTTELQTGLATSAALTTAQADLDDIQTRLPAALVSGRMDSSVGAMAADTLTASALAADAVTEIVAGVAAYAYESGRTLKGLFRQLAAVISGKATGLTGATATYYRSDGITAAVTANQDTGAGTRDAATVGGD